MHIRVVDKNGATISFWRSVFRYMLFTVPYYLEETFLSPRTPEVVSTSVSLFTSGLLASTLYLVVFNSRTRQGIHDLLVGSYVADADKDGPLKAESTPKVHWWILGLLLTGAFVGTEILGNNLAKSGDFSQLLDDVRLVGGLTDVQAVRVQDLNWRFDEPNRKKTLVISVRWSGASADEPEFADQVAKLVIEHDTHINAHDSLRVEVIRGYYLGIAHAQVSHYYEHTLSGWNARFFEANR